jgi:hypothetical protein
MKDILTFEAEPFEVSFEEEMDLSRESGQYEREFVISGSGSCTVYVDELRGLGASLGRQNCEIRPSFGGAS